MINFTLKVWITDPETEDACGSICKKVTWPTLPRIGESLVIAGNDLMVTTIYHNYDTQNISVEGDSTPLNIAIILDQSDENEWDLDLHPGYEKVWSHARDRLEQFKAL